MVKIRLRRMGGRNRPFYRVVVSDSRRVPRGPALEEVGYYDPRKNPPILKIDRERIDFWVKRGAVFSDTVSALVAKASKQEAQETTP